MRPNGRAFFRSGLNAKKHVRRTERLRVRLSLFQPREDEDIAHFAFARDSVLLEPWLEVILIAAGHISPHVCSVWSVQNAGKPYHIESSRATPRRLDSFAVSSLFCAMMISVHNAGVDVGEVMFA